MSLYTYVWCIDHGCNIVRCDDVFEHIVDDKVHYYLPDFIVNGELTEIKGGHFSIVAENYKIHLLRIQGYRRNIVLKVS